MLFTSEGTNLVAWDAKTGKALWHSQIGGLSSPPETFLLDGKQHLLANGTAGMYMFILN